VEKSLCWYILGKQSILQKYLDIQILKWGYSNVPWMLQNKLEDNVWQRSIFLPHARTTWKIKGEGRDVCAKRVGKRTPKNNNMQYPMVFHIQIQFHDIYEEKGGGGGLHKNTQM
jgi:hypothetical protein